MISKYLMRSDAGLLLDKAFHPRKDCTRPCQMDSGRRPTDRRCAAGPSFLLGRRGTLGAVLSAPKKVQVSRLDSTPANVVWQVRMQFLDSEHRFPEPRKGLCLYFKC